ncbi:MAG: conserved rane protein of unknown function, contains repeat, partial [Nitrospira sp.]|nr:conserved rane protein of unknown function, contains repeat [Nitrospira sp.]
MRARTGPCRRPAQKEAAIVTLFIVFLSMSVTLFATVASADEPFLRLPFGERAVLQPGQVVQGDYFAFGPHVEISGIVNGDLYAAGGQILVDGVVNGDVIAAGGKVILSGTVAQDARIAGGQ